MAEPIKILIVEDLAPDVEILKHQLRKCGIEFTDQVVETEEEYLKALQSFSPEVILSDYALPRFDGLKALQLRNEVAPDIPFILVTGSTNEEIAVECMKSGAGDYLIKDHITRIGHAIETAVKGARLAQIKQKTEKIQQILFNISNAIVTTADLEELNNKIRNELGTLLDTSNFYIAYFDETTGLLSTPHAQDEKDCFETWPAEKSLTGYVIHNNKPLLVRKKEIIEMHQRGEIELVGTTAACWLGVPLIAEGNIMGALAVQHYDDEDAYQQQDVEMLEFVSAQISLAIQRKKAEEALRESENKYRTIFETIQDIYFQVDQKGKIREITPSIFRYSGYTREELIGRPVKGMYYVPGDRKILLESLQAKGEIIDFDVRLRSKDQRVKWASLNAHNMFDAAGNHCGIEGSMHDITARKRDEEVRQVLYNISRATLLPIDVEGLVDIIRQELGKLIDTKNFFVALYDEATNLLHAPYWRDQFDKIDTWPADKSVTGIIIRENKSLLLKRKDILQLRSKKIIGEVEVHSECWLGVPLREKGKV
ncbi:MAG: GAF domain-containing protein, partial [Bacteroidales bacterium]|nr:GAF domain-containing protein [Bacteroidales bacterium]